MAYFLSPALVRLRSEINALWPHRDRAADGWIGDTSHQARKSDHNPDYSAGGIVRAYDIDEDLVGGLTHVGEAVPLVNQLIRDPRAAYVIYEGRIWQNPAVFSRGGWLPYYGPNAHRHHVHVSVRRGSAWDRSTASWGIARTASTGGGSGSSLPDIAVTPVTPIAPTGPTWEDDDMALSPEALAQIKREAHDAVIGVLRSDEAQAIIRDAVLTARLDQGVGNVGEAIRDARVISRRTEQDSAATLALLRSISTGDVIQIDLDALAAKLGAYLPNRVPVLPDLDIERIRDEAVISGLELSKGHVRGSLIHLQRATTAPPPA